MQITKRESVEVEVTVDVSIADIVSELPTTVESTREVVSGLSKFLTFAKAVPDEILEALNDRQREIIRESLAAFLSRLPVAATATADVK